MVLTSYQQRRGEVETYFDRTAVQAWARLTSDAPVGRVRATVRAGRDQMRATLLSWLPSDLRGLRVLDAGCGTGAFAVEAAKRGAQVVAVDLSPTLIHLAKQRVPQALASGCIDFVAGDMLSPTFGEFDYVVAMDSLIHYQSHDTVQILSELASRTKRSMLFTFAPKTPALTVMHAIGKLFPRSDRAPAIEPVAEHRLHECIASTTELKAWTQGRTERIASGFYTSQAMELIRE
jgi:magnesium-protoporphyrin O-methyltransferase